MNHLFLLRVYPVHDELMLMNIISERQSRLSCFYYLSAQIRSSSATHYGARWTISPLFSNKGTCRRAYSNHTGDNCTSFFESWSFITG